MSSIQLAEFVLLKSIKQQKRDKVQYKNHQDLKLCIKKSNEIISSNEMICRVCTNPADIPISDKIDGLDISSAIRRVSYVWVSNTDPFPQYVCKTCLEELKVAMNFKRKCETSESLFRRTYSKDSPYNNSNFMVKHDFALIINQMKERRLHRLASNRKQRYSKRNEYNVWDLQEPSLVVKNESMRTIKCHRCDLIFDSKDLLKEHRLKQICICPPCPICGKLVANLERHKKNVHLRTEKYTCHICGKISYTAGSSRNHLLIHSDKFDFSCPLCPYKGKQQAYLTLHMRIHTGEKPYLCSECPAKFVNPSNLRKHQLTHSSKKFECTKCKKQFRLKKSLQEHYDAAHLNVRYRCSLCGRDLWTRRKLLSHELRVHNREKHKLYDEMYKVVLNTEND